MTELKQRSEDLPKIVIGEIMVLKIYSSAIDKPEVGEKSAKPPKETMLSNVWKFAVEDIGSSNAHYMQ